MTLDDIKAAVDAGQTVHWANIGYVVHKDWLGSTSSPICRMVAASV